MKSRTLVRRAAAALAPLFIALATAEAVLELVSVAGERQERAGRTAFADGAFAWPLHALYEATREPFSWRRYFVENYERGVLVYEGLHRIHPTRGWTLAPGLRVVRHGARYTTNSAGARALREYDPDPDRFGVLVVGDSFTFGDGIDDEDTWPELLQRGAPDIDVYNLAVTGYGVGQMYVTLREEIDRYRPRVVVAAFIDEDLRRSLLSFRDFKKPQFRLEQGELEIAGTPIGDPSSVYREAKARIARRRSRFALLNAFRSLWAARRGSAWDPRNERICVGECVTVSTRLFEQMTRSAARRGAEFLLVYLPWGAEIQRGAPLSSAARFVQRYAAGHPGARVLDLRPALQAASFRKARGHYRRGENLVVSRAVLAALTELPSWQRAPVHSALR